MNILQNQYTAFEAIESNNPAIHVKYQQSFLNAPDIKYVYWMLYCAHFM